MSRRWSSCSFEKVMESPFSMKDINGSNRLHGAACSQRSGRGTSVKVKTKSAPCGRKLRRRKKKQQESLPSDISRKSSTQVSLQSLKSPTALRSSSHWPTSLAKIDSPDLLHKRTDYKPQMVLKAYKQPKSYAQLINPSSSIGQSLPLNRSSHVILKSGSSSITSVSSTTANVNLKLSRNCSSTIPTKQQPPKSITRIPFSLKRELTAKTPSDVFGIEELALGLKMSKFKKVVVMSGAGISTASGIPDFRTPGTGLYDNLKQYQIPEPSAIFDITFFARNPRPFFTLARELYPGKYSPNIAHYFIRLLQEKDLLLRHYTQNIDGLERLAGIRPGKLVESHGSFSTASCTVCQSKHDPVQTRELILKNKIPHCKHKFCRGMVKPDIVFFGEDLPRRFHALRYMDLSQCDLLIVMGTSLEVEPFANLVTMTRYDVPRVLLNREKVGPFKQQRKRSRDASLTGDISDKVKEVVKLAGWMEELDELMSSEKRGKEATIIGKTETKTEGASSQATNGTTNEGGMTNKDGPSTDTLPMEHDFGLRDNGVNSSTDGSLTSKDDVSDKIVPTVVSVIQESTNEVGSTDKSEELSRNFSRLHIKEKR